MRTRRMGGLAVASALALLSAAPAGAVGFTPGASGAGDPYFPQAATVATTSRTTP